MKQSFLLSMIALLVATTALGQRPSKEQMEADKKRYAEAVKKLNEKTGKMDPETKRKYDSMLNSVGMGQRIDNAMEQVNNPAKTTAGLAPVKNSQKIAAMAATPSTAGMGSFVTTTNSKLFAAVLPAARSKANEIYNGLRSKKASAKETGNAAAMLWVQGRTQIALCVLAQACAADPSNTDNLNNYASMLTMMGGADLAIPILNNLNARFKKNSTVLNNLGQAWFALGETEKADKYLDSTLLVFAAHPQANLTKSVIAQGKGNKAMAVAYAKASFKQAYSGEKKDQLQKAGYQPDANDYTYPVAKPAQTPDVLNLAGSSMPSFPKSVAESKALAPIWKAYQADIDGRLKGLQKITEESSKATAKQLEAQQKQFMQAMNKVLADPNSMTQGEAMAIAAAPLFSERVGVKEKLVLDNLNRKRQAAVQAIVNFVKGDGAAIRSKYDAAKQKIAAAIKEAEKKSISQTVNPGDFCPQYVKAANEYLNAYNTKFEALYYDYLATQKHLLNEYAWSGMYTTYPNLLPGLNAGLQMNWLRDLAMYSYKFESITNYDCEDSSGGKGGRLTAFRDPHCDLNSDFSQSLGVYGLGFRMQVNCSGITTSFNALIVGVTLNQDLDHAGFGDAFKSCTVSIGPKVGVEAKLGPIEAGVEASVGADIEIDRSGVKDVTLKGGVEVGAEVGEGPKGKGDGSSMENPVKATAGMEGSISLNTGVGSIGGTGIFK